VDLEAIFEFICEHPPMALVSGGILCLILAVLLVILRDSFDLGSMVNRRRNNPSNIVVVQA